MADRLRGPVFASCQSSVGQMNDMTMPRASHHHAQLAVAATPLRKRWAGAAIVCMGILLRANTAAGQFFTPAPPPPPPALACHQMGAVASSPAPAYNAANGLVQIVVGDHYWSCPCGETRKLVGDNEHRNLVGDNEHRNLVGDNEHRNLVGDNEQRNLVGDSEHRNLVGDNEHRNLVGDNEQRRLVGDAGGLQCRPDPQCGGFVLLGANVSEVRVLTRSGLQPANPACIAAY